VALNVSISLSSNLRISNDFNTSTLTLGANATTTTAINLNNNSLLFGGSPNTGTTNTITVNDIVTDNAGGTAGNIIMNGTNKVVFANTTANNTFRGAISINTGIVQFNVSAATAGSLLSGVANGAVAVNNGGGTIGGTAAFNFALD